jgi:glycosyltransferase involved in cell wall biosynthesis
MLLRRVVRAARRVKRAVRYVKRGIRRGRRAVLLAQRRVRRLLIVTRRRLRATRHVFKRSTRRAALLARRHSLRARRRALSRARRQAGRVMARVRPSALTVVKRTLLPWHRVTLFENFWRHSTDIVADWQPDVVHSCDLEGLVTGRRVARRLGVPHVHDCHELFLERVAFSRLDKAILGRIERRNIRGADVITVVNESIGEEYAQRFNVQSVVVRNCADRPDRIVPRDIRGLASIPPGVDVVLYQGGLQGGRGLHEVVQSAQWLPRGAFLVFLGFGPLREELEELTSHLDLADRVRFVEAVPPDELLGVTATASVGVVPYQPVSLNNKLSLPNKIFEYLTVGLPVVVSDVPELRRIVHGAGCGRTYDSFDPRSLAAAVTEVLVPAVRAKAAAAAREYGELNTWEAEQRILHGVYDELLARTPRSIGRLRGRDAGAAASAHRPAAER